MLTVLVPLDGVSVIHGELMVKVVVSFSVGDQSGDEVILRGVLVIEGSLSEPVGQRVDTEGRLNRRWENVSLVAWNDNIEKRKPTWWTKHNRAAPAKKNPPAQSPQRRPATAVGKTNPIPMIRYTYH